MKLFEVREQRALKVAEMRALAEGEMNADKKAAFDKLKTEVVALEQDEARAAFLEEQERRSVGASHSAEHRSAADLESRVSILNILQAGLEGRALSGAEAEYAAETERRTGRKAQGVFVPMAAFERRVNTTTTGNDLVPTDHRGDQYINPLRNALMARRLGVRVLSGLRGNVTMPKRGTGLSVGWVAENGNLGDSDMGFDPVTLAPKHAGGITEMSRQLIQQSSPDIEQLVRDDLAYALAKAIDSALILGGGANEPVGVLSTVGIQTANLATLSWANINVMLEKAELENAPVASWLTHAKAKTKLATTLKASGIAG